MEKEKNKNLKRKPQAAATDSRMEKECNVPIDYSAEDPFGSYTGVTEDGEKPVQDQDDL